MFGLGMVEKPTNARRSCLLTRSKDIYPIKSQPHYATAHCPSLNGAYPEVMCATEDGLEQRALYGLTGRMECVGPVGPGSLEPYAYDKAVMAQLWSRSGAETGFSWAL